MLGRTVVVPEGPLRLVSLAPSLTETIFAVGRGDWVVGVTEACDYPAHARDRASVGSMASPNLERIVKLRPDLVLTSAEANTRETLAQLDRLRLPVFAVKPEKYEDILTAIRLVGAALRADAAPLVQDIRARVAAVRAVLGARPRLRVLYLIWADPPIAAGPAAFIHDLIELAGGANVIGEPSARYLPLGWEEIVARRPEVILVAAHQGATNGGGPVAGSRAAWGRWESLPAVKSGRVLSLPADAILRPGPRVADGVAILARAIHPDAFPPGGRP
jgi:iron complex transport system substrate-binding protein